MNPVCEDIKDKLVEAGVGEFTKNVPSEWGIFTMEEPDSPDNVITIYQTPGTVQKIMNKNNPHFGSGFQVRVRVEAGEALTGHAKAEECRKVLDRIGRFDVGDVEYDNISIDDEPVFLLKDSKARLIFIVNGTAFRQERLAGS